jgi:hypothetical protein
MTLFVKEVARMMQLMEDCAAVGQQLVEAVHLLILQNVFMKVYALGNICKVCTNCSNTNAKIPSKTAWEIYMMMMIVMMWWIFTMHF